MSRLTWLSAFLLSAAACGSGPTRTRTVAQAPAGGAARASRLPELVERVRGLASAPATPDHQPLVAALEALAGAIESAAGTPEDAAAIRRAAQQLDSSSAGATNHADIVRGALADAHRVLLGAKPPEEKRGQFLIALGAMDTALDALNTKRPLLEQHAQVVAAFEAATDVVHVASGLAPPFPFVKAESDAPRSLQAALDDARANTLALARAEWGEVQGIAAKLMNDFASILAASGRPAANQAVAALRFAAQRLAKSQDAGVEEQRWIKEGLSVAIEALGPPQRQPPAVRDAIDAIDGLGEGSIIAFQRGEIQDAVRATLAAYLAVHGAGATDRQTARRR